MIQIHKKIETNEEARQIAEAIHEAIDGELQHLKPYHIETDESSQMCHVMVRECGMLCQPVIERVVKTVESYKILYQDIDWMIQATIKDKMAYAYIDVTIDRPQPNMD